MPPKVPMLSARAEATKSRPCCGVAMLREGPAVDVGKDLHCSSVPVMTETILRPCSGLDVYVDAWVKVRG